jgi:DUF971 family protein
MTVELDKYKPKSLKGAGDGLAIEWADGASTFVPFTELRKKCPCATCNDERQKPVDPFRVLSEREIQAGPPKPVKMLPRGYYAYQIVWNDGHDSGIYTLEMLRDFSSPVSDK